MSLGGRWCASETLTAFFPLFLFVPCVGVFACLLACLLRGHVWVGGEVRKRTPSSHGVAGPVLDATRHSCVCLAVSFRRGDLECGLVGGP